MQLVVQLLGQIGAFAGAIIGGIAGGIGAKAIADQFIEDDRVEMFAQLKEEFIDHCNGYFAISEGI